MGTGLSLLGNTVMARSDVALFACMGNVKAKGMVNPAVRIVMLRSWPASLQARAHARR
jgi:hypothetical protein